MKKIFGLLLLSTLFSACGSDDSGPAKVPTQITMSSDDAAYNNVYTLEYDSKNRMTRLHRTGGANYDYVFHYENGDKPQSITATGDVSGELVFSYDSQKRLTGAVIANNAVAITYQGDAFTMNGLDGSLTSAGDLKDLSVLHLSFDATKKGAMANVRGYDGLLFALIEGSTPFFFTKKPCVALTNSNDAALSSTITHTYEKGFPILTQSSGAANFTAVYTYSN